MLEKARIRSRPTSSASEAVTERIGRPPAKQALEPAGEAVPLLSSFPRGGAPLQRIAQVRARPSSMKLWAIAWSPVIAPSMMVRPTVPIVVTYLDDAVHVGVGVDAVGSPIGSSWEGCTSPVSAGRACLRSSRPLTLPAARHDRVRRPGGAHRDDGGRGRPPSRVADARGVPRLRRRDEPHPRAELDRAGDSHRHARARLAGAARRRRVLHPAGGADRRRHRVGLRALRRAARGRRRA